MCIVIIIDCAKVQVKVAYKYATLINCVSNDFRLVSKFGSCIYIPLRVEAPVDAKNYFY